jgi:hypothetical protein
VTFGERQGRERKEEKAKKNTHFLTSVAQKQAKEKKVKLMIGTRSKVKSKEGKEPLYHTLGAVAGERQIRNILRGRLMRL